MSAFSEVARYSGRPRSRTRTSLPRPLILTRAPTRKVTLRRRLQVNSRLALRSWWRATTDTDAPGRKLSSTIRRFSPALQDRRAPRILATHHAPACTKDADRAHQAADGHSTSVTRHQDTIRSRTHPR